MTDHGKVGVAGTGNMGAPMARNLVARYVPAGGEVLVHARSRERVEPLLAAGASWAASAGELAAAGVLLLMLPDLPEVEQVLDGVLPAVSAPLVVVVGSTCSPDGVRRLGERVADATGGLASVVDAPVSGGVDGAEAGSLAVMVGGDAAPVERAWPVLDAVGTPVHLGPLGSGQIAKACNQAVVASTIMALGEAFVLAHRSGLDLDAFASMLGGGYAGSRILETRGRRLVEQDYAVSGPAKFMVKDLGFALAEAVRTKTVLPQTELLLRSFEDLVARGMGDSDIAVTRAYVESLRRR